MKRPDLIKRSLAVINDPERDFSERIFLLLTFVAEVAAMIALISDLAVGENMYEAIVVGVTLVIVPLTVFICLHFDRLYIAIRLIVLGLVFIVLPGLFFFGGGLEGGGVLWVIFAFMYVGLVLRGRWRKTMFVLITLLALVLYLMAYYHPEVVYRHSQELFHIDSFISLILVGILCYVMTWFQGRLFTEENLRAKKEKERAEELTRSQNRFFSSMSHEIRTPINSILGLNELILRDQSASDDIINDANGIQGSGKMLLTLINDILDFSKIEAGSMEIVPVDYRVGDMLSEVVNMMWLRAHDKDLRFEVSVDPRVPAVLYGDEVRIKQVMINLLNNAVKYTEKGRVELHVESRSLDNDSVELWISVSDTGIGIRRETLPYLFDAFRRVDEGRNRHIEGTGLGLSIVKQLVELMGGTVSVNSVYGEGSTFTVMIKQLVSDSSFIGELNIHNQQILKRSEYESSFLAPEARILMVDDNEMNLEVESRLLEGTDMGIDKAHSGREALELCTRFHYDAIFMDHLMPEMDGIECLELIRHQSEGLNRNTPVIVLTANAGSWNREVYNKAGFDGYLIKPVSGQAMEEMLIRHISSAKIILRNALMSDDEDINASDRFAQKSPVIIATSSMCDLPESVLKKLQIPVIPFVIRTGEGVFRDGVHIDGYELIRYVSSGGEAFSSPPDEQDFTEFFSDALKRAHHLIYIAITSGLSEEYRNAIEAAKSFDNVTVINSECVSSATGILVLMASRLALQGLKAEEIASELEMAKHRLRCSLVIDSTEYLLKKGLVSRGIHRIAGSLNFHPALRISDDGADLGGFWFGRLRRVYRKYIRSALAQSAPPDREVVFVPYVDIPTDTLDWIEKEIKRYYPFERVVFIGASAAISLNSGPGTFGLQYYLKTEKSYNLASLLDDAMKEEDVADDAEYDEPYEEEPQEEAASPEAEEEEPDTDAGGEWYEGFDCIDTGAAIKNSGSPEAFRTVLKMFHDSLPDRVAELESCLSEEDFEHYTIKIHALKSSARLVGALELGDEALQLENAGERGDTGYIRQNHPGVMEGFLKLRGELGSVLEKEGEAAAGSGGLADEAHMEKVYSELRTAAGAMDFDMIETIMKKMEGLTVPEREKDRFDRIRGMAEMYDYDGMLELLS